MSNINEKNYTGSTVIVVGKAGGPVEVKTLPNGSTIAQLSIAVGKGYKNRESGEWIETGTDWYTLTATEDWAENNWPVVDKGDTVRIDEAALEARAFSRNSGEPGVALDLRFGTLTVVRKKQEAAASNDKPF